MLDRLLTDEEKKQVYLGTRFKTLYEVQTASTKAQALTTLEAVREWGMTDCEDEEHRESRMKQKPPSEHCWRFRCYWCQLEFSLLVERLKGGK